MDTKRIGRQTPTQSVTLPYTETKGQEAADLYAKTGNEFFLTQKQKGKKLPICMQKQEMNYWNGSSCYSAILWLSTKMAYGFIKNMDIPYLVEMVSRKTCLRGVYGR